MDHQKRFILAMVLSGLVLVVWQVVFPPPMPELAPPAAEQVAAPSATRMDEGQAPGAAPTVAAQGASATGAAPDSPVIDSAPMPTQASLRTDALGSADFRMEMTNKGAVPMALHISNQYDKRGNLLDVLPADAPHRPFAVTFLDGQLGVSPSAMYEVVEDRSRRDANGVYSKLVYRHVDAQRRFSVDKIFTVDAKRYMVTLDVEVTNHLRDARLVDTLALDVVSHRPDESNRSFLDFTPQELAGHCVLADDEHRTPIDQLEDGPLHFDQNVVWGGVDTRYFLHAAVPTERPRRCQVERVDQDYLRTRLVAEGFSVAPGQTHKSSFKLYNGPKDLDSLREAGDRLEKSIDYGMFAFLALPLRSMLVFFNEYVKNWGLAIILLTLLIKIVTWPITDKTYANGERMKKIQPELQRIKEQYANDQQRITEETMRVMRENKVNPLGCFPMLIQIPILYALYVMILNSVELYHAEFALWYQDLSAADPFFVLPLSLGGIMVIQQALMPVADSGNPQMKIMMRVMPVMFTAFMLFLPSGLVLYYWVSTVLGLGQQYWIKRKFTRLDELQASKAS